MTNDINPNSILYQLCQQLISRIQDSNDEYLRETYKSGNLVYLDDSPETLQELVSILADIAEHGFDDAPTHLIGELRDLTEQEVRKELSEADILLYGRSGMRLNSRLLKAYES